MLRSTVSQVMWVGRATVFLVGLSVILAVVVGVASAALGANGDFFKVGRSNFASAVSELDKSGAGPALRLLVDSGPPLAVNSGAKVTNLNADKLDGKSATQIGLNGREVVSVPSATNSNSPKMLTVSCPAGKFVVGTGFDLSGGKTGTEPNAQTDVVIDQLFPGFNAVALSAYEETPTSANWNVAAYAVCAKAP